MGAGGAAATSAGSGRGQTPPAAPPVTSREGLGGRAHSGTTERCGRLRAPRHRFPPPVAPRPAARAPAASAGAPPTLFRSPNLPRCHNGFHLRPATVDGARAGVAVEVAAAACATAAATVTAAPAASAAAVTSATHYTHDGIPDCATTTIGRHDCRAAHCSRRHRVDEAAGGQSRVGAAGHGRRPHRCGERTRSGRVHSQPDAPPKRRVRATHPQGRGAGTCPAQRPPRGRWRHATRRGARRRGLGRRLPPCGGGGAPRPRRGRDAGGAGGGLLPAADEGVVVARRLRGGLGAVLPPRGGGGGTATGAAAAAATDGAGTGATVAGNTLLCLLAGCCTTARRVFGRQPPPLGDRHARDDARKASPRQLVYRRRLPTAPRTTPMGPHGRPPHDQTSPRCHTRLHTRPPMAAAALPPPVAPTAAALQRCDGRPKAAAATTATAHRRGCAQHGPGGPRRRHGDGTRRVWRVAKE